MNNNSAKILLPSSCTHPPRPLLLQAIEGGVKHFAPLCEAERGWGEFIDYIIDI